MLVYGGADQRVPVEASVRAIRDALAAARLAPPMVCIYPGADHTLMVRRPGDVWPRNAEGYLEDVIAWVRPVAGTDQGAATRAGRLSGACS